MSKVYQLSGSHLATKRLVMLSAIGTISIATVAEVRTGDFESMPRIVIGAAVAFFIVGAIAEVNSDLGKALAGLILIGTLFTRGPEAFGAIERKVRKQGQKHGSSQVADRRGGR